MADILNNNQNLDDIVEITAAVNAFNILTGDGLLQTAEHGQLFLTLLDLVRSQRTGK